MDTRNGRQQADSFYSEEQVRHALRASGVRIAGEIATHFMVFCEYHDNRNTAAAEVDKSSGLFYCFSCGATTDLPHLVMRAAGINYFQALRLIGDNDYDIAEEVDRILNTTVEPVAFDQAVIDRLHADINGVGRDYLLQRHITDSSIDRFELGFSKKQSMVTIPVHGPTGILWGFVGRSITGKRFKNSKGLLKAKTLFNLHRVWTSSRVYVVESSFDAIRLDQVGHPAVATLGAGISTDQIDLLKRTFDDIVLIPDDDGPGGAGEIMTNKVLTMIPHAEILKLDGAHDVGDLTDADLTTFI